MAKPVSGPVEAPERIDWRDLPPVPEAAQPHFPEGWTPSQTFLRTMDFCDRAALLHLQHGGGAATHELNRGSIVHETIDRLLRMLVAAHRERRAGAERTDFEYEVSAEERSEQLETQLERKVPPEMGRDVLTEVMHDNPELQVSAEERDACRYMVDHWCRGFEVDPSTILGIEKTLTLETGGFRVLTRPDLILEPEPRLCEIVDWKTAWPPDSEDFRAQAWDAQGNPRWAGNYQLNMGAVVAAFGITDDGFPLGNFDRFRLVLAFPRILREDGIDTRVVEVDRLQVQAFREDLDLQLRRLREVCMAERKWQATAGNHCRECPAEVACPLPRVLRPESQNANLDSVDDLEKIATTWYQNSRSNTRLKARLKKAAESFPDDEMIVGEGGDGEPILGVRIGRDTVLAFVKTKKTEIPDKANLFAAAEAAANFGEPFNRDDYVKVSEGVEFKIKKVPQ